MYELCPQSFVGENIIFSLSHSQLGVAVISIVDIYPSQAPVISNVIGLYESVALVTWLQFVLFACKHNGALCKVFTHVLHCLKISVQYLVNEAAV